jgi:hypothetical protein
MPKTTRHNRVDSDESIEEEVEEELDSLENVSFNTSPNPNNTNWKTLVLISVNLAGFEIKMNVGNVMGNVW